MQEPEREIINVEPNEDGRIIINLYGADLEIDNEIFDEDGIYELKKFGKIYEIHKPVEKKRSSRKKKEEVVEEEPVTMEEVLSEDTESVSE